MIRYGKRNRNKLGNTTVTIDGITFDSKKEGQRYSELRLLERAGKISDLRLQVEYDLIPAHFEEVPTGEVYKRGEHMGEPKMKTVCVERAVSYIADFVYKENGVEIVEDVKGFRDPECAAYKVFVLKRKLMLHKYGIRVREI